jgi:hypothetical protein
MPYWKVDPNRTSVAAFANSRRTKQKAQRVALCLIYYYNWFGRSFRVILSPR